MTLDELALKHGTDKSSAGHGYCSVYEGLLPPRDTAVQLLEIGVHTGASVEMWDEWLTDPRALITGVDIAPTRVPEAPRIAVYTADIKSWNVFEDVIFTYDVVIDDGSHHHADIVAAYWRLSPFVHPGGQYFIEDVAPGQWEDYLPPHSWPHPELILI